MGFVDDHSVQLLFVLVFCEASAANMFLLIFVTDFLILVFLTLKERLWRS